MAKQERFKETVMDKLIERELLAIEAERLGFVVTQDEVEDQIAEAKIIGLGSSHTVPSLQKDGQFSYEAFKMFLQYQLGITPKTFIEEQKKELLASRVRDLLRSSVTVSEAEVKDEFLRKNRQVNLEYVRFSGRKYEAEVALTEAEMTEYAAKNEAKLKEAYEQKKFVYEKAPAQRRLWQILIKVPQGAIGRRREGRPQEGGRPRREGAQRGEGVRQGGADLHRAGEGVLRGRRRPRAKAAISAGGRAARRTCRVRPRTRSGTPRAAPSSAPCAGTDGFVITKVEGSREGQVPFDKAKLELAEEKLREEKANTRAKEAAAAMLAKAKETAATPLKTMFPAPSDSDEASASAPGPPRASRRPGCFRCAPPAKGPSSKESGFRTTWPRRLSR